MTSNIRNIAIIAHVDHGKTTLVDQLLRQSGMLKQKQGQTKETQDRLVMDSNELEQERGITILAKNTAVDWNGYRINIVDTPGHADFGGEVERVLSMVDSVLLLVDAVDGPMPQTRFVTQKAFNRGLNPIVVINKVDRHDARPSWVIDRVFDLFEQLGATDKQLDFPIIYASALRGFATMDLEKPSEDMNALFQLIIDQVPPPEVDPNGLLQMQITSLDYSSYVGTIGIGRIKRGKMKRNMPVTIIDSEGQVRSGRILQILGFLGLQRYEIEEAGAGDIVAITGIEKIKISDTICDPTAVEPLPPLAVDEPTVHMTFEVNTSPFAGREGKYLTSRQLRERLQRELLHNVALRVEDTDTPEKFKVSGRGELHLAILIETMRREGYELAVSKPQVIVKDVNGEKQEPFELLIADIDEQNQGAIMEALGARKGDLIGMYPDQKGRVRLEYMIPTRGLIGFQTEFMILTSGTGILNHVFDHYGLVKSGNIAKRLRGVLIANGPGKTTGYSLFNLQERAQLIVGPQVDVYEGMVVGINSRAEDLVVNPVKPKQLTNMRASGSDENIILTPPLQMSLERAIEFIEDDELVEITPTQMRIRKKLLSANERKRESRA
ncbi:MAG: GTP-binding protein TypA [Gammaproteobacteria bacterium GWE2_37_16]|nr:MAG: GTP-binding protein TypA [Gammaproteobacteria bacterium GWE2_37_16]